MNKNIESDNESPENMEDLLQAVESIQFLSTTDFVCGYWQVPLAQSSRKLTAFVHCGICYQFTRDTFGIKTAGSGFIRAVGMGLGAELMGKVRKPIDDFLIKSETFGEYVVLLDEFFGRLTELGFTLNLSKSQLFRDCVKFLGVIVDRDGVRVDPEKIHAIQAFEVPRSRKQLQGFLGVCGFSRRFVANHSDYVAPFRDLLKPSTPWQWTEDHTLAFNRMKENFLRTTMLHHFFTDKPFKLQTDASAVGVCGVVYRVNEADEPRIVSIVSRVLTKYESEYSVTEKELLVIIYPFLKLRRYLIGQKFEIITDHKALTFFMNTPYHNARMTRWLLFAQEYDFTIKHCRGIDNVVADFFSRNIGSRSSEDPTDDRYFLNAIHRVCILFNSAMRDGQRSDAEIARITIPRELLGDFRKLSETQKSDANIQLLRKKSNSLIEFRQDSDILYCKLKMGDEWKVMVPRCVLVKLLTTVHDQLGHAGSFKMYEFLARFFFWRFMRRDIKLFASSCDTCQRTKYLNHKMEGSYEMDAAEEPNKLVAVDFFGPLPPPTAGVSYIFVTYDVYSKLVRLYAIKCATTKICLHKLNTSYFPEVGTPEEI